MLGGQDEGVGERYLARVAHDESRRRVALMPVGGKGAIAIEVKIAERWSYRELVSAISEQIVGQYLRDPKSTYGVLAIASSGPRRGWQHEDGRPIATFAELLEQLEAEACRIAMETRMKEIRVVGVDLH